MVWRLAVCLFLALEAGDQSIEMVVNSGRIIGLADTPSERLSPPTLVSPGAPPVLSFRYFDAADKGRFGNLGLMTDDAGH